MISTVGQTRVSGEQVAILAKLGRAWAGTPDSLELLTRLVSTNQAADSEPDQVTGIEYVNVDGIAMVWVQGPLVQGAGECAKRFGIVDPADLRAIFRRADEDASVAGLLIGWDSPGGCIQGIEEAAADLAQMSKPTISHTADMMASAAYWIGAAADEVWTTNSAEIGCIGVYSAVTDYSKMLQDEGIERIRFRDGDLKGIGLPGVAVETHEREHLQASIETAANRFRAQMRAFRPTINDEAMRGQCLPGHEAPAVGLADKVGSVEEAAARLSILAPRPRF